MGILIKMIGTILVIAGSGGCGWYFANEAKVRVRILQELQQGILVLYGEMEYAGDDMEEILEGVSKKSVFFADFFENVSKRLKRKESRSLFAIWQEEMAGITCRKKLKEEDLNFLEELGKNLGNLDRQTQLHTLKLMSGRLEKQIAYAREEYQNKAKVYRVLGVTVGVFATVLLL